MLLLVSLARACDTAYSNAELAARTDAALALYEAFEVPAFRASAQALEADVACASEPTSPALAARVHVAIGLLRWTETSRDRAAQAWAAARRADPDFRPSEALFPADSAERALWDGIGTTVGAERPLPKAHWWVDGHRTSTLATERPALVQELDRDGDPVRSAYAWPDAGWPPVAMPAPRTKAGPLLTGAASLALAGVGAGLFGSAYAQAQSPEYADADPDSVEFQDWYRNDFASAWYGGITLLSVGAAGLAVSTVWLVATPSGVAVHGAF